MCLAVHCLTGCYATPSSLYEMNVTVISERQFIRDFSALGYGFIIKSSADKCDISLINQQLLET